MMSDENAVVANDTMKKMLTTVDEVKMLLIASIKEIGTIDDPENMLRRTGNTIRTTINNIPVTKRPTSTTILTISSNNITTLCAVRILRRTTNGTQSTLQ